MNPPQHMTRSSEQNERQYQEQDNRSYYQSHVLWLTSASSTTWISKCFRTININDQFKFNCLIGFISARARQYHCFETCEASVAEWRSTSMEETCRLASIVNRGDVGYPLRRISKYIMYPMVRTRRGQDCKNH